MKRKYIKVQNTTARKKNNALKWFLLIAGALVTAVIIYEPIAFVVKKLIIGLIPFFIALLVVYLLKQPRKFIANKLLKNAFKNTKNPQKWRMNVALIIVFTLFLAFIIGMFWLITPKIISMVEELITNSDTHIEKLKTELKGVLNNINFLENFISANTIDSQLDMLNTKLNNLDAPELISKIGGQLLNIFNLIFIGIIFGFLILLNIDKYKTAIREWYSVYHSKTQTFKAEDFIHKTDKIFVDYGFSKLIEGLIILASVTIGLIICGSPMPFELALFMAFLNVIPYIGPIIALVPILLINLILKSVSTALISTLVALLIVVFVTGFITPLIVGKKIKLDIFTVLFSLTLGSALFGAVGMIIAPPITATILYTIKNAINNRKIDTV